MKALRLLAISGALVSVNAFATTVPWDLSSSDFFQDWSNTGQITANDDWSGVSSIVGYHNDGIAGGATGADPQTILADNTTVDVIANLTNPNTSTTGGVGEFHLADAVVALQGSGNADAPALVIYVNAANRQNVTIRYKLRDIDGSTDNSIQPVALQYRTSNSGNYTNVASAFVADASSGPSLATLVTNVSASNALWDGATYLEFRIMTNNAAGSDEWIGVDDISITSDAVPEPATMTALGLGIAGLLARKRKRA